MARQKALQVFRGLKIPKADANDGLETPGLWPDPKWSDSGRSRMDARGLHG